MGLFLVRLVAALGPSYIPLLKSVFLKKKLASSPAHLESPEKQIHHNFPSLGNTRLVCIFELYCSEIEFCFSKVEVKHSPPLLSKFSF